MEEFDYDGLPASYIQFLRKTKGVLESLKKSCINKNIKFDNLPEILGQPRATHVKLIDEYYWMTITNEFEPPKEKDVKLWLSWL